MLLNTPDLFLLWHVKMAAVKTAYSCVSIEKTWSTRPTENDSFLVSVDHNGQPEMKLVKLWSASPARPTLTAVAQQQSWSWTRQNIFNRFSKVASEGDSPWIEAQLIVWWRLRWGTSDNANAVVLVRLCFTPTVRASSAPSRNTRTHYGH